MPVHLVEQQMVVVYLLFMTRNPGGVGETWHVDILIHDGHMMDMKTLPLSNASTALYLLFINLFYCIVLFFLMSPREGPYSALCPGRDVCIVDQIVDSVKNSPTLVFLWRGRVVFTVQSSDFNWTTFQHLNTWQYRFQKLHLEGNRRQCSL